MAAGDGDGITALRHVDVTPRLVYFRPGCVEYPRKELPMACFIIGAGSFYGLPVPVQRTDMVIAADGG